MEAAFQCPFSHEDSGSLSGTPGSCAADPVQAQGVAAAMGAQNQRHTQRKEQRGRGKKHKKSMIKEGKGQRRVQEELRTKD